MILPMLAHMAERLRLSVKMGTSVINLVGARRSTVFMIVTIYNNNINNNKPLRCFSPQANYTERATAACRRS
jgi:hypothetical protein